MRARITVLSFTLIVATGPVLPGQSSVSADRLASRLVEGPLATRDDELNAAFTPDGRTLYFTKKLGDRFGVIVVSHLRDGKWSPPEVAPFSGQYPDYDPFIAPDGNRLFWISSRPVDGKAKTDYDIWMVERRGDGWGPAIHLDTPVNSDAGEYYPTVAANGNLYFSSSRPGGKGRGDVYRSRFEGGSYSPPENLGDSVNSAAFDGDPFIAPDESYLVFTGYGRPDGDSDGDLYVATSHAGVWAAARRLGHGINSEAQEYTPIVSPDGKWLYFTSYRAVIDEPLSRPLTSAELRQILAGPLDGHGNVYRIPIEAVVPGL